MTKPVLTEQPTRRTKLIDNEGNLLMVTNKKNGLAPDSCTTKKLTEPEIQKKNLTKHCNTCNFQ